MDCVQEPTRSVSREFSRNLAPQPSVWVLFQWSSAAPRLSLPWLSAGRGWAAQPSQRQAVLGQA